MTETKASEGVAPARFQRLTIPGRLYVPIGTGDDLASRAAVRIGNHVTRGEALIENAPDAAPIPLAPCDGRITDLVQVQVTNGREVCALAMEPDPAESPADSGPDSDVPFRKLAQEWLKVQGPGDLRTGVDRLRGSGVWAARWTSPDLLAQLGACHDRPPDTIICTLLDSDRGLFVNRACAQNWPDETVAGVAALARLTSVKRAWLIVDADEPAWESIRKSAAAIAGEQRLVPIDNDYPQIDPTLLLNMLLGRRLPPGRLPTDRGVLLLDAAAAIAVARALVADEPMLEAPVVVYDRSAADPNDESPGISHLVLAPIGTRIGDILDELQLAHAGGRRGPDLWAGGPLRECKLDGNCIIAGGELGIFAAPREAGVNPLPCIRCGWCVEGCPVRANPAGLLEAAQRDRPDDALSYGLDACIECGICSYVCPSHLPLLQGIRILRRRMAER